MTDGLSLGAMRVWAQSALVAGPALGWLGHVARRPSWSTLPAALAAPVVVLVDSRLRPAGPSTGSPTLTSIVALAALSLSVALVVRSARHPERSAIRVSPDAGHDGL